MRIPALVAATALAACQQSPADDAIANTDPVAIGDAPAELAPANEVGAPANTVLPPARTTSKPAEPIGFELTIAQWRKADNRAECAPLVLNNDGGERATPRAASFAGGWGIAFDQPRLRSAYGVAGAGVHIADEKAEIARISRLFPYVRPLGGRAGRLPGGTTAAYGIEGASAYRADNPSGKGDKSLAYVVVPRQHCLYNVWSSLGREHLETMLDHLTMVPTD